MQLEGPSLESLTRRLTEMPEEFLAEPRLGESGSVRVAAVVNDLLRALDDAAGQFDLTPFRSADARRDRNRLAVVLILCSLLADEWFRGRVSASAAHPLLSEGAALLATTSARKFIEDAERREEMTRFALAQLGLRPAGETMAQAQDRLTSISSAERARVIAASRAAELRARQIREALVKKAAEESADKWTRE